MLYQLSYLAGFSNIEPTKTDRPIPVSGPFGARYQAAWSMPTARTPGRYARNAARGGVPGSDAVIAGAGFEPATFGL